jgi:hypothetical protein
MSAPTPEPASKPSAIMLLRNADANLEILHLRPERVQPLRLVDIREYRDLLDRVAARVADLREDISTHF